MKSLSKWLPAALIPFFRNLKRRQLRHDGNKFAVYYTNWLGKRTINGQTEFTCRSTTADHSTFDQVFGQQEYNIHHLVRGKEIVGWYHQLGADPLIIDCGANIGASPALFATLFPNATILAVEPDKDNYELLVKNARNFHAVNPLLAAVAGFDGWALITNAGDGANMRRTKIVDDKAAETVKALSLSTLLSKQAGIPFILKVDIEGAELDFFAANTDALSRFPIILVELHDWLYPGKATSRAFLEWHAGKNRDFIIRGETIISISNDFNPQAPPP